MNCPDCVDDVGRDRYTIALIGKVYDVADGPRSVQLNHEILSFPDRTLASGPIIARDCLFQ
jgi:hypothetical protein